MEILDNAKINSSDLLVVSNMKKSLKEYADIIVSSPIFNKNNNTEELSNTLYIILYDLYLNKPEDVINFLNQKPSKTLVNAIFASFGSNTKLINKYPIIIKVKTSYLL